MAEEQRTVVIGVDDSKWSDMAFDYFLKNVYRTGDHVIAVHCVENLHPPIVPSAMTSPEWGEHVEKHTRKIKEVEATYTEKAKQYEIPGMIINVVSGSDPGHTICKEAEKAKASLVVVGSRGAGVIRRTVLGSVSSYVVHHADMPVLVCPKPHSDKKKESPQ